MARRRFSIFYGVEVGLLNEIKPCIEIFLCENVKVKVMPITKRAKLVKKKPCSFWKPGEIEIFFSVEVSLNFGRSSLFALKMVDYSDLRIRHFFNNFTVTMTIKSAKT